MAELKLWLISQKVNNDYDTFDSAVVCASSQERARRIHPAEDGSKWDDEAGRFVGWNESWAKHIAQVDTVCIGRAATDLKEGQVVCASFNAG